jgi:hypothetical protein
MDFASNNPDPFAAEMCLRNNIGIVATARRRSRFAKISTHCFGDGTFRRNFQRALGTNSRLFDCMADAHPLNNSTQIRINRLLRE